jgi:hypothetical protein
VFLLKEKKIDASVSTIRRAINSTKKLVDLEQPKKHQEVEKNNNRPEEIRKKQKKPPLTDTSPQCEKNKKTPPEVIETVAPQKRAIEELTEEDDSHLTRDERIRKYSFLLNENIENFKQASRNGEDIKVFQDRRVEYEKMLKLAKKE